MNRSRSGELGRFVPPGRRAAPHLAQNQSPTELDPAGALLARLPSWQLLGPTAAMDLNSLAIDGTCSGADHHEGLG